MSPAIAGCKATAQSNLISAAFAILIPVATSNKDEIAAAATNDVLNIAALPFALEISARAASGVRTTHSSRWGIANITTLRRRGRLVRGPRHRDIRCQTRSTANT